MSFGGILGNWDYYLAEMVEVSRCLEKIKKTVEGGLGGVHYGVAERGVLGF
jgi:hypothetical protein